MYSLNTILLHFLGFVLAIIAGLVMLYVLSALLWSGFKKYRGYTAALSAAAHQRTLLARDGCQHFNLKLGALTLSPQPFSAGQHFRIDISGVIMSKQKRFNTDRRAWFPARYIDAQVWGREGESPGSWTPHSKLFFDSSDVPATPFISQRHLHHYSFAYQGTGSPLSIHLEKLKSMQFWDLSSGWLSVSTSPLCDEDRVLAEQHAAEAVNFKVKPAKPKAPRTKKSSRVAHLQATDSQVEAPADGGQAQETFNERLRKLNLEFANPNYSDDQWLKNYARKYTADLLKSKSKIESDYIKFHKDSDFIHLIKTDAPEVYKRAIWQYRALTEAERVDVEEAAPKPKQTPDEHRESDMNWKEVLFQDFLVDLEFNARAIERLQEKQKQLGMDDEQFDQYLRRFQIMQRETQVHKEKRHGSDDEIY